MSPLGWGSSQSNGGTVRTRAVRAHQLCHFLTLEREFHLRSLTLGLLYKGIDSLKRQPAQQARA